MAIPNKRLYGFRKNLSTRLCFQLKNMCPDQMLCRKVLVRRTVFFLCAVNACCIFLFVAFLLDSELLFVRNTKPSQDWNLKDWSLYEQRRRESDIAFLEGVPQVPKISTSDVVQPIESSIYQHFLKYDEIAYKDKILILTPIHNVAGILVRFSNLLKGITYPHELISIAFGEDCSTDATLSVAKSSAIDLQKSFPSVKVFHFNLTGQIKGPWNRIHNQYLQLPRRKHLAQVRNMLLKSSLEKEHKWVLWIDSDISFLPPNIIELLLSSKRDIVVPLCVYQDGSKKRVFDKNTWRETNYSLMKQKDMKKDELMLEGYGTILRLYLSDLRAEGRVVPIDGVGGCTLLINADLHRKGLEFPETILDHHIETEGLAKLAKRMGWGVYGMPYVEVFH